MKNYMLILIIAWSGLSLASSSRSLKTSEVSQWVHLKGKLPQDYTIMVTVSIVPQVKLEELGYFKKRRCFYWHRPGVFNGGSARWVPKSITYKKKIESNKGRYSVKLPKEIKIKSSCAYKLVATQINITRSDRVSLYGSKIDLEFFDSALGADTELAICNVDSTDLPRLHKYSCTSNGSFTGRYGDGADEFTKFFIDSDDDGEHRLDFVFKTF